MSQSKRLWAVALIGGLIVLVILIWPAPGNDDKPVAVITPTAARLTNVESELAEWADGRWSNYSVRWDNTGWRIRMSVTTSAEANDVAVNGYCRIMGDIAADSLSNYNVTSEVKRISAAGNSVETIRCR